MAAGLLEVEGGHSLKPQHQRRTGEAVAFVFVVLRLDLDSRPAEQACAINTTASNAIGRLLHSDSDLVLLILRISEATWPFSCS